MFKYFYKIICKFFSYAVAFYENLFLKKKQNHNFAKTNLLIQGFEKIILPTTLVDKIEHDKIIQSNKYMKRIIIKKKELNTILRRLFVEFKLSEKITNITNFNYSIDYIIYYKNISIDLSDRSMEWYANHWHRDQPMSRNSLKIIFPLQKISELAHGGIKILDIENSKNFYSLSETDKKIASYKMISDTNELIAFLPNLCFHKAGEIEDNYVREQIMIQLNPSKNWCINSKIYEKQYKIEPKFPFFAYLFDKKERIFK